MRKLYVAAFTAAATLFGLVYLKNRFSYGYKSLRWRLAKSLADTVLIIAAANYVPALLVGWTVMWVTRPIKRRGIQVTLAVLAGMAFGAIGGVWLEVLCLLAVFSVDLLTGSQGVYGWWTERIPETFMPYLNRQRPSTTSSSAQ